MLPPSQIIGGGGAGPLAPPPLFYAYAIIRVSPNVFMWSTMFAAAVEILSVL